MRYNIVFKGIALVLTVCCLITAALCGVGIFAFSQFELYGAGYESYLLQQQSYRAEAVAQNIANHYAIRTEGDMSPHLIEEYGYTGDLAILSNWYDLEYGQWGYELRNTSGRLLTSRNKFADTQMYKYSVVVDSETLVRTDDEHTAQLFHTDKNGNEQYFRWEPGPMYEVTILFTEASLTSFEDIPMEYIQWAMSFRYGIIFLLVGALALGAVCFIYLCCAAGRSGKSSEIRLSGLNRLPLDLYAAGVGIADFFVAWVVVDGFGHMCFTEDNYLNTGIVALTGFTIFVGVLLVIGWLYAVVSQIKMRHFYWWHHSVVGWILGKVWQSIRRVFKTLRRGVAKFISLLPMVGRRVLLVVLLGIIALFMILFFANGPVILGIFLLLALIFGGLALFAYDTYAFGTLMQGAKRMAEGDLATQIPTRFLFGSYKDHAERLNTMADVATVAAKKQMKSERMKAELITNVSHDIKTPLTSIINYVDLLKKPHTQEEGAQYLNVLDRQSAQMKKLLEDLMEMSKASTGNMTVEIDRVDAVEAVNQALGEFSDKLNAAQLISVFKMPEEPVFLHADGRLTWRVLNNLLSNVVKYALPGTRVYLDLTKTEHKVLLSVKNISREELNVTADELTERFVRGDASRNTEGSGLGLNIAKSLMELQKGSLELTVDGDLFKVTLTFPGA